MVTTEKYNEKTLISYDNTLILKGLGIILMFIHHLFYSDTRIGMYWDFSVAGISIVHEIGLWGKVCVALFVFLSGYGLSVSIRHKPVTLYAYYLHRMRKLMLNYWFVWIIMVPIGVFIFHRSLEDAYGEQVFLKCTLDFLGLINFTGAYGYNSSWWFYSCIIFLYLIFPLLNRFLDRTFLLTIGIAVLIPLKASIPYVTPIANYLLPFLAGIWVARLPADFFYKQDKAVLWITLIFLGIFRNRSGQLTFITDTFICMNLAFMISRINLGGVKNVMVSLGRHSMNMFLCHTFFTTYWFKKETYIFYNPVFILLQLLLVCFLISIFIEFIKQKTGFSQLY